jgi:PPM family protein phosphatase
MSVVVQGATDVGRVRARNEDHLGVWVPEPAAERERRGVLVVVADGMGGSAAGDVASRIAVDTFIRTWRGCPGATAVDEMALALETANRAVHAESLNRPEQTGMGTTCTALLVRGREAFVAHVGDSRAYLVRGASVQRLTRDHSLVAELVREGHLTEEQARSDPRRNVVTRSVGVAPRVTIDAERVVDDLAAGDTLVVCSDGLHGLVTDEEIGEAAGGRDLSAACDRLIALANERGGYDNITLAIVRVNAEGA